MTRYVCIHGHFYQPPRENPWLEAVEAQESAAPFHDWNERILAECYAANALSRILDDQGQIERIVNNYGRISFNFGPTLLSWLEDEAPAVYQSILMADWMSQDRFGGHGSAMAQPYNHMILPLAPRRDRVTQIRWGLADFEARFGRAAEGMWLPETAVDPESLDLMAEQGVAFTVLAPHQALRVRPPGGEWRDVSGGRVDTTRAYSVAFPSGRSIAVFFYDGAASRAVAFEGLLESGDAFANRLLANGDGLTHIATDGESYGHHHRFGDMALAFALHKVESHADAQLTNYGQFLALHPPEWEAEIAPDTSWSCAHGVERWRSDCGCATGLNPGWRQDWRAPLRAALDSLRDSLAGRYEDACHGLLKDCWRARDEYIRVILDRSSNSAQTFFAAHAQKPLSPEETVRALKLLEMQRHALLMYTSCGWFFDDLAGLETMQNLQYAGRAAQLAQELFGDSIEEAFLVELEKAHSNKPGRPSGREVYAQTVRPARADLSKAAAQYAITSLFETVDDRAPVYSYRIERERHKTLEAGRARLAFGRVQVRSRITRESGLRCYAALHFGDHNVHCGVRPASDDAAYDALARELEEAFLRADFPAVIRFLDRNFEGGGYSLKDIFADDRRKILGRILRQSVADAEAEYLRLFESHAPLLRFLAGLRTPIPRPLQSAAEIALNSQLRGALEAESFDDERIRSLLEQADAARITLDSDALAYALRKTIERLAGELYTAPSERAKVDCLLAAVSLARSLPFWVDLWKAQNVYYEILQSHFPRIRQVGGAGSADDRAWADSFLRLGALLKVKIPPE